MYLYYKFLFQQVWSSLGYSILNLDGFVINSDVVSFMGSFKLLDAEARASSKVLDISNDFKLSIFQLIY